MRKSEPGGMEAVRFRKRGGNPAYREDTLIQEAQEDF
jgi:hypothetical protein